MDDEVEGLSIALTPVQMAAVLGGQDVPESASWSNRLWGTVGLVGGVVELVGAGVLCVAPEPTMVTKAGCVVLGVHSFDTMATSGRQIWTGTPQRTATAVTASSAAEALGASRDTADGIGLAVDVAVPLVVASALGAARIVAVMRGGRIRLAEHEAAAGSRLGGHTMARHVGQTDAQLLARVRTATRPGPRAVSTFGDLATAERAITETLRVNAAAVRAWSRGAAAGSKSPELEHVLSYVVGRGVQFGSTAVNDLSGVRIILKMESYNGKPFYILTAYPI
ncbi:RNase A-like domain-containing protein [Variovorax sp. 2RAF20]|uniref:RNase A-like domain-containing protein n=1 Tax=Variovorax sp. CF313 TaxID=1144315 RepID=UPI0002711119|nr:RNase A-like domain-containing protein [Variovorax sp. CF313]EJL78082.1 hypothetical protein PMI12_01343 [Variovorax sp. CF313]